MSWMPGARNKAICLAHTTPKGRPRTRYTPDVIGRPSGVFETGHEPWPVGVLAGAGPWVATLLQSSFSPRVAGNGHGSALRACGCSQLNLLSSGLYRRLWPWHQIHRRSGSRAREATMWPPLPSVGNWASGHELLCSPWHRPHPAPKVLLTIQL